MQGETGLILRDARKSALLWMRDDLLIGCHGRTCSGHPRFDERKKGVDAGVKPGHDDSAEVASSGNRGTML